MDVSKMIQEIKTEVAQKKFDLAKRHIKEVLDVLGELEQEEQQRVALALSDALMELGLDSYHQSDMFSLTGYLADCRDLVCMVPQIKECTLVFLELMMGLMELKLYARELEMLNEYAKEIAESAQRFSEDRLVGMKCCACFANLTALCSEAGSDPMTSVSMKLVDYIADQMEQIVMRFPNDAEINLAYCHVLTSITAVLYNSGRQVPLERYKKRLQRHIESPCFSVPRQTKEVLFALQ